MMTGASIEAKPQKIVAGLEPEVFFLNDSRILTWCFKKSTKLHPVVKIQILLLKKY